MNLNTKILFNSSYIDFTRLLVLKMKLVSGHEVEKLEGEELSEQRRNFSAYDYGLTRLHPGRWFMPESFIPHSADIYNFKVSL